MTKFHICKHCGNPFNHKWNTNNMFCSRMCYFEYRKAHPDLFKTVNCISSEPLRLLYQCVCEYCDKPFETTSTQQRYCSKECAYEAQKQRAIKRQHERNIAKYVPKTLTCKECGKSFVQEFGEGNNTRCFCSYKCRKKYYNRRSKRNRDMRVRGVLVDKDITLKQVAMRDNNVCYLCGHPVDWSDYSNDEDVFLVGPNYPSIDHVHPIAKGGKHKWDNVRLAHCHCNSEKRDNVL